MVRWKPGLELVFTAYSLSEDFKIFPASGVQQIDVLALYRI